jgi:hypothetical protein
MADELAVKLLEEIRDLQKEHLASYLRRQSGTSRRPLLFKKVPFGGKRSPFSQLLP